MYPRWVLIILLAQVKCGLSAWLKSKCHGFQLGTTYIEAKVDDVMVILTASQSPGTVGKLVMEYAADGHHCHQASVICWPFELIWKVRKLVRRRPTPEASLNITMESTKPEAVLLVIHVPASSHQPVAAPCYRNPRQRRPTQPHSAGPSSPGAVSDSAR